MNHCCFGYTCDIGERTNTLMSECEIFNNCHKNTGWELNANIKESLY